MALCPRAEEIIREQKIVLRPSSRQKLATYDPDTQVQWLVNPMIQCLIEKTAKELLGRAKQHVCSQQIPVKPDIPDVNPPDITPDDPVISDEPPIFSLFGPDDDY
uniref:Uncharacterized protein n=1 Tax=Marseillevirus LCMAC101 TaxID=2506602 RepID=A0A481YSG8_9VIRU|nr:MAG: hypothetical protein LCMAC101_07530 [Marseillevirus LCMAC101]